MDMNNRFRIVLAGCGGISAAWLKAIQQRDDVDMVAFVDLNLDAARNRAAEFGWDQALVSADLQQTLESTNPDIVFDCTIPEAHHEVTTTALLHGCHVLGEKPMSVTIDSAREMIDASRKAGKTYAVTQTRRFDPNIRRLTAFLRSGAIGEITEIHTDFFIGAHFGGFRDLMSHVLIIDMAIHTFDAARMLSGLNATSVYCEEWNPSSSWYARDASAMALFSLSNGAKFIYRGSWCAEGFPTTWESQWRIIGEKGTVIWDGAEDMRAEITASTGGFHSVMQQVTIPQWHGSDLRSHASAIDHFLTCLKTGEIPETCAEDNIHSLAMVLGAVESSENGTRVSLAGS